MRAMSIIDGKQVTASVIRREIRDSISSRGCLA